MTFIFQQKAQPSAEKMDVFFRNGKNAVLRKVNIMKREGQVRIRCRQDLCAKLFAGAG